MPKKRRGARASRKGVGDSVVNTPRPAASSSSFSTESINLKEMIQTMTVEEQLQCVLRCNIPDEEKQNLLYEILWEEFMAAPYYQIFQKARAAQLGCGESLNVIDEYWNAFKQASALGPLSAGRIFLLTALISTLIFDESGLVWVLDDFGKFVRRLRRLFHNQNELTTIRVLAASFLCSSVIITREERAQIFQDALLLGPTPEEQKLKWPVLLLDQGITAKNILQILEMWKENMKQSYHRMKQDSDSVSTGHPHFLADGTEIIPSEQDADLFWRTSEVGGHKCDYCKMTVEQLGTTKLKLCSQCQNAYYCGAECQLKAWKEGHKKACRPDGVCAAGDIMRLVGVDRHCRGFNGRLVKVMGKDTNSNLWHVHLIAQLRQGDDASEIFSVKAKSLKHIRPAA